MYFCAPDQKTLRNVRTGFTAQCHHIDHQITPVSKVAHCAVIGLCVTGV